MSLKYLEIEEEQAQNFFKAIDLIVYELKHGCYKGKSYKDFVNLGVFGKTLQTLKRAHYISYNAKNKNEPIWLSWENRIYPDNTILNLRWDYIDLCGYDIAPDCNEVDENMIQYYYNATEMISAKKEEEELTDALNEIFDKE
jgi:hypothetical protein